MKLNIGDIVEYEFFNFDNRATFKYVGVVLSKRNDMSDYKYEIKWFQTDITKWYGYATVSYMKVLSRA